MNSLTRRLSTLFFTFIFIAFPASISGFFLTACLENPGPDSRLNQIQHEYQVIGVARYRGLVTLEFAVKEDSDKVQVRIVSVAHDVIDSVTWFMQIADGAKVVSSEYYRPESLLDFIGKGKDIHPGDTVYFGPIAQKALSLEYPAVNVSIIQIAEREWRGSPFGGVYSGSYSAQDTTGYSYKGSFAGMIDADGNFNFHLDRGTERGIKGLLSGVLDDSNRVAGTFIPQAMGAIIDWQTLSSETFTVTSGESHIPPKLSALFRGLPQEPGWLDSLRCEAVQRDFIKE
jgi:hypothetical protein